MKEAPTNGSRSGRLRRRLRSHFLLFIGSCGSTVGLYFILAIPHPSEGAWIFRWSVATAYVASALLVATLSIGVWYLLRWRSIPLSTDVRRDVGIWCCVFAIIHTCFGLNVHMKSWIQYFVDDEGGPRFDLFGLANYLGILALVIVLVLLVTSNDRSVSILKSGMWKRIQRLNYAFAALAVFHGVLYVFVEKRFIPYLAIVTALVAWVVLVQSFGFYKMSKIASNHLNPKLQGISREAANRNKI